MPERAAAPTERLGWADLVKGVCILLVVLWHVHLMHYMELGWVTSLPVRRAWIELHSALAPVRMPLFFTISGTFAAAALARPWRQVAMRRLASPYYLYVVWLCIHTAIYTALRTDFSDVLVASIWQFPANLLIPVNSLWYVYALGLYFLVAKVLRPAPAWLVFLGAGVLSASVTAGWITTPGLLGSVARNFVFFLVGVYLSRLVQRVPARAGWLQLAKTGLAYAGVVAVYVVGAHRLFGVHVLTGLVAIWFGLVAAGLVVQFRHISDLGTHLGRNTLPIYLMHVPLIGLIDWVASGPGEPLVARLLDNDLVAALYPLAIALVVITLSLVIHHLLRGRAAWLFALPAAARQAQTAQRPRAATDMGPWDTVSPAARRRVRGSDRSAPESADAQAAD